MSPLEETRRLPVWGWLVLGVGAFVLVAVGFTTEIRIVVISPDLGDISGLVGAIGTTLATFAGLASFAIAIYNQVTQGPREKEGPERRFRFAGENNEFNLYFGEDRATEADDRRTENDEATVEREGGENSQEST